ncbi:GM26835 [Drosophila sechellia]|uniref:GM26835 n=1 Tax=Drosophila sechellia TaxID=7238 RepID=B4IHW5_DROSE|nr:GM26835 [Drosophila sechellia]
MTIVNGTAGCKRIPQDAGRQAGGWTFGTPENPGWVDPDNTHNRSVIRVLPAFVFGKGPDTCGVAGGAGTNHLEGRMSGPCH